MPVKTVAWMLVAAPVAATAGAGAAGAPHPRLLHPYDPYAAIIWSIFGLYAASLQAHLGKQFNTDFWMSSHVFRTALLPAS